MISMFADLFRYHDWANRKILLRCDGLSDAALDATAAIGFGSLRATLCHLVAAERLWLDRWLGLPWKPLDTEVYPWSPSTFSERFDSLAADRDRLVEAERPTRFERVVSYRNTQGASFQDRLADLLLHVVNHGIHHRAQALQYLRRQDCTFPGGLDYLFYRVAFPIVPMDDTVSERLRGYGLEVSTGPGNRFEVLPELLRGLCRYGNWAMEQLGSAAERVEAQGWDKPFAMGMGSLRKTMLHCLDAERWWYRNWTEGPTKFEKLAETTAIDEFWRQWQRAALARDGYLTGLRESDWERVVTADSPGGMMQFHFAESIIQICGHGTHHRAQALNMLRQLGVEPLPALDYVAWMRQRPA